MKTLRAFLAPLQEARKELRMAQAKKAGKDIKMIRHQAINIILTIKYVVSKDVIPLKQFEHTNNLATRGTWGPGLTLPLALAMCHVDRCVADQTRGKVSSNIQAQRNVLKKWEEDEFFSQVLRWFKSFYTLCCSLTVNILSLTPTSNSLTQKYIHFNQSTFTSVDTKPFASKENSIAPTDDR